MCLKKHFQDERKAAQSANQASLAMMMSPAAAAAANSNDIFNDGLTEENIALSVADMTLEEAGVGDVTSDPLPMMKVKITPTDK